ncbi:ubiquitin conjugating enzyme 9 [Hibiscus trionum]|uniref:Ubiquitin conjugating enzyme 9 n=1 Tax=Hibiscus trionum TaxID=183268 RepID=A0A9W7MJM3_HIBTR|nr:ubiquitin conjugating enzyme 9 [Hibiscus trionum]
MAEPAGSPYEGHEFDVSIIFPPQYPHSSLRIVVTFDSNLFHPNITESCAIRLAILHESWSPCITHVDVVKAILAFLCTPNADAPYLECEGVALIYKRNPQRFAKYARKIMG